MIGNGSWSLYSEIDSRWNCNGRGYGGFLCRPTEIDEKIKELKKLYGEPPDDLRMSFFKD